jgi:hypothetical protein
VSDLTPIAVGDEVTGLSSKMIAVDSISVPPDRMRKPRPDVVDELAASIATEGLLQPIVVRPDPKKAGFLLVAGWHRLEAKRKLKHETIECRVLDGLSADQARVAEIDENLIRADLTPSERAAHHAERKALYLRLHPETQQGGSREGAGRSKRDGKKVKPKGQNGPLKKDAYTKDAAKKAGKSSRTIKRGVRVHQSKQSAEDNNSRRPAPSRKPRRYCSNGSPPSTKPPAATLSLVAGSGPRPSAKARSSMRRPCNIPGRPMFPSMHRGS